MRLNLADGLLPLSSEGLAEHWPALVIVMLIVFGILLYRFRR